MQTWSASTAVNNNSFPAALTITFFSEFNASLLAELESVAAAYKRLATDARGKALLKILHSVCWMLCFSDASVLRHLPVRRYAEALVFTLGLDFPAAQRAVRAKAVEALALVSGLVPRGSQAMALAGAAPLLLGLAKAAAAAEGAEGAEGQSALEELLRCLSDLAAEAHTLMLREDAVAVFVALESRVQESHLRVLCLRSLATLFSKICPDDWDSHFLLNACLLFVDRFRESTLKLLRVNSKRVDHLNKRDETHILCGLECISFIFERLLSSPKAMRKNKKILEKSVPIIVGILEHTSAKSANRRLICSAAYSPLLMLYITAPTIALKIFTQSNLIQILCAILVAELDGSQAMRSGDSAEMAKALNGDDVNSVPYISGEQQVISLLEVLLVIIPAVKDGDVRDWYVTLPYNTWQSEDIFHNRIDFNESVCKKLESEYQSQRMSSIYSLFDLADGDRFLRFNFQGLRYINRTRMYYSYNLHRNPTIVGFVHRPMARCYCGGDKRSSSGPLGIFRNLGASDVNSTSSRFMNARSVPPVSFNASQVILGQLPMPMVDQSESAAEDFMPDSDARTFDESFDNRLLEDEDGCCSGFKYFWMTKVFKKGNKKRRNDDSSLQRDSLLCLMPRDVREEVLRSGDNVFLFLNDSDILTLVSWCIPACLTTIKRSVSTVIARHCSILIFRCVYLVSEFMHRRRGSRLETVRNLQLKLSAMSPEIGKVLTYFIVTLGSTESQVGPAYPGSEFGGDPLLQKSSVACDARLESGKTAPSLLCEVQMSALSTFLLLHSFMPSGFRMFSDTQRLAVLRHVEGFFGLRNGMQLPHFCGVDNNRSHILCPFHATVEEIEESNKILLQQVAAVLQTEAARESHPISPLPFNLFLTGNSRNSDSHGMICGSDSKVTNPLEMPSIEQRSFTSRDTIIKDLNSIAELYDGRPETVKWIIALSDYIKADRADMLSLIHKLPDFFDSLATGLKDPVVQNSLDTLVIESSAHIAGSLTLCISEHIHHVSSENICTIDQQPPAISRRFSRSQIAVNFNEYLWTPLRVKLVLATSKKSSRKLGLRKAINLYGKEYPFLDVEQEADFVTVLPTTPLSYLAKIILSNLGAHYAKCRKGASCTVPPRMPAHRRAASEEGPSDAPFPGCAAAPPLLGADRRGPSSGGREDRPAPPECRQRLSCAPRPAARGPAEARAPSPTADAQAPAGAAEEGGGGEGAAGQGGMTERLLSASSVSLPYFLTQQYAKKKEAMEQVEWPAGEDPPITVTTDNIIFICDGKPVTNLSASVLELCCSKHGVRKTINSFCDGEPLADVNEANKPTLSLAEKMHSVWSKLHSIQFAVLEGPISKNVYDSSVPKQDFNHTSEGDCQNNNLMLGLGDNSNKRVFARLLQDGDLPLRSAARLLHGLKNALLHSSSGEVQHDRRLSGALIYNFYTRHSTYMLPPLTLPAFSTFLYGCRKQHLPCYILWNYPNLLSFEMRRTLLHLILATRRVESSAFTKLQSALQGFNDEFHVHGLEWLTSDVTLHRTKRVKVSRDDVLGSGIKILRSLAMCPLPLSVQFEMEDGAGVGPAMEFYNMFALQMQSIALCMWKTEEIINENGVAERRVQLPLFPALHQTHESLAHFEVLGLLVGRVLMEERAVDLPLHTVFLRGILGNFENNKLSDIDFHLNEQYSRLVHMDPDEIEACELFFVLSHDGEKPVDLCPDGSNTKVTADNVQSYVEAVERYYCHTALLKPILSFLQGLRYTVIPEHLQLFVPDELNLILCGPEGKIWECVEDIKKIIIPSHGYVENSLVIHYLLEVLLDWSASLQRAFLRFVTASSRIPVGGLNPPITVVRRPLGIVDESGVYATGEQDVFVREEHIPMHKHANASLPTVNTCVHYLKLPNYSTKELLEVKLRKAVMNGQERFFLT